MFRRVFSLAPKTLARGMASSSKLINPYLAKKITVGSTSLMSDSLFKANPLLRNSAANIAKSPLVKQLLSPDLQVEAALLDGSGTTMDEYVIAPAYAFVEAFDKYVDILKLKYNLSDAQANELRITMEEARGPMMLRKDLHIDTLYGLNKEVSKDLQDLTAPIKERWKKVLGRYPTVEDSKETFKIFTPIQDQCMAQYCKVIPGAVEAVNALRAQNIKIGFTTGFARSQVDIIEREVAAQGLKFDFMVAGNEVINGGRPSPSMVFKNMDGLNLRKPHTIVKVDDTVGGVGEGLNAGMWSVGITDYSNYMNINSKEEAQKISKSELEKRQMHSRKILEKSGAHYLIKSPLELPGVIADINNRLKKQEYPMSVLKSALKKAQAEEECKSSFRPK